MNHIPSQTWLSVLFASAHLLKSVTEAAPQIEIAPAEVSKLCIEVSRIVWLVGHANANHLAYPILVIGHQVTHIMFKPRSPSIRFIPAAGISFTFTESYRGMDSNKKHPVQPHIGPK